jgi:hypothetical protein
VKFFLLIIAFFVFLKCSQKFGFRNTATWASLLVISVFPFTLAAGFVSKPAHFLWGLLPLKARIVAVSTFVIGAFIAVKEKGLGEVLGWAFAWGLFGCVLVFAFFLPILIALASQGRVESWNAHGSWLRKSAACCCLLKS